MTVETGQDQHAHKFMGNPCFTAQVNGKDKDEEKDKHDLV